MLTGRESAFGLVELLVAMFVTMVVIAAFTGMFFQGFQRNAETDATAISSARLSDAIDRVGDDLRSARSAARGNIDLVSTRDDLRTRLRDEPITYGDVAYAGGRMFAAWTDGLPGTTGPSCATYALEQVREVRTEWALVRRMTGATGPCPAPAGTPREVLAVLGEAPPATDAFRYNVLVQNAGTQTCRTVNTVPASGTLDAQARLRIVSVDIDLASINKRRGRQRAATGRSSIDLWSRLNDDYYYALGCAQ